MGYIRNRRHESTNLANVDSVGIRHLKQTLLQKGRRTVRNHTITLHFTEPQTTVAGTTLDGLPRHDLHRTARTRMDLVVDHVAQALVVRGTKEDLGAQLTARVAVVHDLEAPRLVAVLAQQARHGINRDIGKRRRVALHALERGDLAQQTLDQMRNRHARRDGVRVDDNVRCDALGRKRHVLVAVRQTNGTLLTMARGKLVANLRDLGGAYAHLDVPQVVLVRGHDDLVDNAVLRATQRRRRIALHVRLRALAQLLVVQVDGRGRCGF